MNIRIWKTRQVGSEAPKEYDFLLSNHPALDEYLEKFSDGS